MRDSKLGLRALGVTILASLGLMALFAAGAQGQGTAGKFLINGSDAFSAELKAGVTANLEGLFAQLLVQKLGFSIKCKKLTVNNGAINSNTDASGELTLEVCQLYSHPADTLIAACAIHSPGKPTGTIVLSSLLIPRLHGGLNYLLTENFATVEFLGAACAAEGTYILKGASVAEVTPATNNTVKPLITFSEAIQKLLGDKLQLSTLEAFLNVSATFELIGAHATLTLGVH